MTKVSCENCIYFKQDVENGLIGVCIYSAPTKGDIYGGGVWPIVFSDQYCGKYCSKYGHFDYKDSLNERSE